MSLSAKQFVHFRRMIKSRGSPPTIHLIATPTSYSSAIAIVSRPLIATHQSTLITLPNLLQESLLKCLITLLSTRQRIIDHAIVLMRQAVLALCLDEFH